MACLMELAHEAAHAYEIQRKKDKPDVAAEEVLARLGCWPGPAILHDSNGIPEWP